MERLVGISCVDENVIYVVPYLTCWQNLAHGATQAQFRGDRGWWQNLAHGATQAQFQGDRGWFLQPASHLQLERIGTFAPRVHNNSAAESEKVGCCLCLERCSTLRIISWVGGSLGRVSRVHALPLWGGLRGAQPCRREL